MVWMLFVRRQDFVTGEWKRSQAELQFIDYTGLMTYKQVWNKLRPMVSQLHSSRLTLVAKR